MRLFRLASSLGPLLLACSSSDPDAPSAATAADAGGTSEGGSTPASDAGATSSDAGGLALGRARCTLTYSSPSADYNGPTTTWTSDDSSSQATFDGAGQLLSGLCLGLEGPDGRAHSLTFGLKGDPKGVGKKLEILVFGTTWADAKTGANPMVWSLPSGASGAPPASVTSSEAGHVTLSVSEVVPAVSPASARGTVTVSATIEAQLP